jgi:hypothetical protein
VADEPEFTLPDDLAALSAEELAAALEGAVRAAGPARAVPVVRLCPMTLKLDCLPLNLDDR